jgi:hypothetical protein
MDAKPMRIHGWPIISFIKDKIISCWFYFEKYNTWNVDAILWIILQIFKNMNQHLNHLEFKTKSI